MHEGHLNCLIVLYSLYCSSFLLDQTRVLLLFVLLDYIYTICSSIFLWSQSEYLGDLSNLCLCSFTCFIFDFCFKFNTFSAQNSLLNGPIVDSSKKGFYNSYHDSLLAQAFCQLKGNFLLWMNKDTNNSTLVTFLSLFICEITIYTSDYYSYQLCTLFSLERSRM